MAKQSDKTKRTGRTIMSEKADSVHRVALLHHKALCLMLKVQFGKVNQIIWQLRKWNLLETSINLGTWNKGWKWRSRLKEQIENSLPTLAMRVKPSPNLFFKCWGLPRHLNWPFTMTASRVQRASHSSMLCKGKGVSITGQF